MILALKMQMHMKKILNAIKKKKSLISFQAHVWWRWRLPAALEVTYVSESLTSLSILPLLCLENVITHQQWHAPSF